MCLEPFFAACQDREDSIAFVSPEGELSSYGDLLASYQVWKHYLDGRGIRKKTVALQADFSLNSISLLLALIQNHCVLVPIQAASPNCSFYLETSACAVKFTLGIETNLVFLNNPLPTPDLLKNLFTISHPGLILFSSGSSGQPKGAVHDVNKLLPSCVKRGKRLTAAALLLFDHIGGINTVFRILGAGGTLVCLADRKPLTVCRAIEQYKVELLPASPSFLNLLLLSEGYKHHDLSSLKTITYGTEPMSQTLLDMLCQIFPYCAFKQTYGLSELGILPTKSKDNQSLWLKTGGDGFKTRVRSGILEIKSDSAMLGYLNNPVPFDADGWFSTGDKVEEEDGYLKILGRTSDIINVGGEKVFPAEVENTLMRFPGVLDAKVFGEKNALTGEIVKAEIFVAEENYHPSFKKDLLEFCTQHLERYKIPLKIVLSSKPLMNQRLKKTRNRG